jgi:signal transduction histidine kinase
MSADSPVVPADHAGGPGALVEAISEIVAETDSMAVVRTLVDRAVHLAGADSGACALLGPGGEPADVVQYRTDDETAKTREPRGAESARHNALVALVLSGADASSAALRLDDVRGHDIAPAIASAAPAIQSLLGIPIRLRGELLAVLYLTRAPGQPPFDPDDVQLVQLLAVPAGQAIATARAVEAGRRRQQWLQTLAGVGTALLSGRDLHDVLPSVVRQARDIVGADGAALALPTSDASSLIIKYADGFAHDRVAGMKVPTDQTVLGTAFRDGLTMEITDLVHDPRITFRHEALEALGPAVYVPLGTPRFVRGVLIVYKKRDGEGFERPAVSMLTAFATQVAVALELAERQQDLTRLALLEDRERIARDLHDVVIQRLFAIGLTLERVGHSIAADGVDDLMTRAVDDLDQTIKEIRTTIFGLQAPAGPEYSSLRARIVGVVDQAIRALGFVPSLRFEGAIDSTVSAWLADQVVAVLREALSNVARHARATQVEVKLSVTGETLTLRVEDDGIGLRPGGRRSGLHNLEVRAAAHGGALLITPRDPAGTRVEWSVPLRLPAQPSAGG